MTLYYNDESLEVREIDDSVVDGWVASGNPKKDRWKPVPPRPGPDYAWVGTEWKPMESAIPESISARQIRLWLVQNGHTLSQVDAAIDAISDAQQREVARIEWEYAPYIERSHPMLLPVASALGLSQADVDRAFAEANLI